MISFKCVRSVFSVVGLGLAISIAAIPLALIATPVMAAESTVAVPAVSAVKIKKNLVVPKTKISKSATAPQANEDSLTDSQQIRNSVGAN